MKYRIKKVFTGHLNFLAGEIREFTASEVARYGHLMEPIGDEVNSQDVKPNKQYKKGRKKG